jgi:hypothetical protein
MKHLTPAYLLFVLFTASLLAACNQASDSSEAASQFDLETELLTVYKSPTCGCCNGWIDHIKAQGFKTHAKDITEMSPIKDQYRVADNLRSCHTAVSKQGYVFEGHIPARYIQQFLANPPADALGLTVPAMPVGSPGMEVDDKFMPYQVLLMKKDGNVAVFADVQNQASQY